MDRRVTNPTRVTLIASNEADHGFRNREYRERRASGEPSMGSRCDPRGIIVSGVRDEGELEDFEVKLLVVGVVAREGDVRRALEFRERGARFRSRLPGLERAVGEDSDGSENS